MFIFRTVAFYLKTFFLIMSTYIPSCPGLYFKDSCGRPWNYCSPILSPPYPWSQLVRLLSINILLRPIAHRSCSAPFDSSSSVHICTRIYRLFTFRYTVPLDEKAANVTKSSRADRKICADGRAQAVAS